MATSLSVTCEGKRYTAKLTPMQPLQALLEQVICQLRPQPLLKDCSLSANGKPIDLSVPLRFANLPTSAKLEVTTGQPASLGINTLVAGSSLSAAQQAAKQSDAKLQSAQQPAGDSQSMPEQKPETSTPREEMQPQIQPASAASPASHRIDTKLSGHASPATQQPVTSTSGKAAQNGGSAGPLSRELSPEFLQLGLDRAVSVFTRSDLEATAADRREEEPPDNFYEFGVEDYARVMAGYNRAKQRSDAGLRTAKLREQDEREKASRFPAAALRIHFPDGLILQMSFASLDQLSVVKHAVKQCLLPAVAASKWYLYITPPKQVLTDDSASLYRAGLCPAANVYFGCERQQGPYLREEVQGLRSAPPEPMAATTGDTAAEASGLGHQPRIAGASNFKLTSKETGNADGKKVPKWMKLKK